MRFDYYRRLGKQDRATYRESDSYGSVELDDPETLAALAAALGPALGSDDRVEVERLAARLVRELCGQLNVPFASVRVLAERPRSSREELHGLYVREERERPAVLVWMRTALRQRPVAHRAFVRTLLHEVCHHLDYELLELEDSFHTAGFFQRESSLVAQLLPRRPVDAERAAAEQLDLFR